MATKHTNRDHLHVSAMKATLELVHVLGDDAFIYRVELTPSTVVREGASAPLAAGEILFNVHAESLFNRRASREKWK
jgi:hypothetical protein